MATGESAGGLLATATESTTEAAFRTGDFTGIEPMLHEALARARADGDRATEAAVANQFGWLMHFQALDRDLDPSGADAELALFERALAIRRDLDDPAGVAASLFGVGLVHQVLYRDWGTAMPYYREALALADRHGDDLTRSEVHRHVGFFHMVTGDDLDLARHHLRESLRLREIHGDPRWIPGATLALGQLELLAGNHADAVRHLDEAVRQARAVGLRRQRIEHIEEALRRAASDRGPRDS